MLDILDNLIQKEAGRIFIDIATEGCGSGCSYCYIRKPLAPQQLISKSELDFLINHVKKMISDNDILSFCPNTEPLKSEESRMYIHKIIDSFRSQNVIFQISTKESISPEFLKMLNDIRTVNPIYIFVSIPFLEVNIYEPNASSINDRLENFLKIHKYENLRSCFYIKPFSPSNIVKKDDFCKLILEFAPDDICVGMHFNKGFSQPCSMLHNPVKAEELFKETDTSDFYTFSQYLRKNTGKKVFHSSVCILANNTKTNCLLNMSCIDKFFCRDCLL
jgi:hypothetical protein